MGMPPAIRANESKRVYTFTFLHVPYSFVDKTFYTQEDFLVSELFGRSRELPLDTERSHHLQQLMPTVTQMDTTIS